MIDIPGTLGVCIPLLAIGAGIVETITRSQERKAKIRLRAQQGTNEDLAQQIAALRQEVAALRDTSTQFDMSQEHSVQRLEERIGRAETKTAAAQSERLLSPAEQPIGLH